MNLQDTINKAMNSLNNIKKAEANPYLFEKIQAKINANNKPVIYHQTIFNWKIAAVLILFSAINIYTIIDLKNNNNPNPNTTNTTNTPDYLLSSAITIN